MGEGDSSRLGGARLSRRQALRGAGLVGAAALAGPALGTVLEACGGGGGGASNTVVFSIATEPKVLNPPVHTLSVESTVFSVLFPGLLRPDGKGGFVPDLAEDYQAQPDGLKYTFKLRKGLVFDDGQPLTAKDVRFTWQAYVNPRTATSYINGWDQVASVAAPDDSTVVFTMAAPYGSFLINLGCNPVLPQHVLQSDFDNLPKSSFNRKPVGAGPYKFKSWQTASQITFTANPHFHRGTPKIQTLVFKIDPDENTQVNELQTGGVDVVPVTAVNWNKVKSMQGVSTYSFDNFPYQLIQLDQWPGLPGQFLSDVKVRQALAWATPKQAYVKDILKGLGRVADADVAPISPYYNAAVQKYTYDLSKAGSVLQDAGFTLQGGVMTRGGAPLTVPIYVLKSNPALVQFAQVLKESWTKLGVKTDVAAMDASSLYGDDGPQYNKKDAAVIYAWGAASDPDDFVNWNSTQIPANAEAAGDNNGRYSNPEMDRLTRAGQIEPDAARRKQIYGRIQEIPGHRARPGHHPGGGEHQLHRRRAAGRARSTQQEKEMRV